ncbi:hypothetical protein D3C83_110290 [compost metagenome]
MNAADPHAAKRGVLGLGDDECVLDRNARLVVVAVEHPLLELGAGEPAFVHQRVVAVPVVIAGLAFAAQPVDEFLA